MTELAKSVARHVEHTRWPLVRNDIRAAEEGYIHACKVDGEPWPCSIAQIVAIVKRYRDAEWAFRIHEDEPRTTPEHNARVDEWRAAEAAAAELIGARSPFALAAIQTLERKRG